MRNGQNNNTAPREVVSVQTADDPFSAPGLDRRFSFYRAVNERIREVNAAFAAFVDNIEVFCECGARNCLERIEVPAKVYEDVLSGPRSLVKAGHESRDHGVVVAESGSYVVIEADAGMRSEASCSSSSGRQTPMTAFAATGFDRLPASARLDDEQRNIAIAR